MKPSVAEFMSFVHTSVNEESQMYLANERRYNYTTPKSFLEQVCFSLQESASIVVGDTLITRVSSTDELLITTLYSIITVPSESTAQ